MLRVMFAQTFCISRFYRPCIRWQGGTYYCACHQQGGNSAYQFHFDPPVPVLAYQKTQKGSGHPSGRNGQLLPGLLQYIGNTKTGRFTSVCLSVCLSVCREFIP
jgi:hypothetical protein